MDQLAILAGLRRLGHLVQEEINRMPITASLADHDLFGPVFKKGLQEGRQEGLHEGELLVLRRQIITRFGAIPAALEERLERCSTRELEDLSVRVLDAQSLDDFTK
jgi:flagellar biosynthesis/type III secretory pathway protein FliH